jgi:anti-anti-sigma regulatory factor
VIPQTEKSSAFQAENETAIVFAGDYLNKLTGEKIERECKNKLEEGYKQLIVSFKHTEIVNSIGISILLGVIDSATGFGAKIVFSEVNENNFQLFEMLGLTNHVTVEN